MSGAAIGVESSATTTNPYVGRFAPSPTGPLHLGSLTTAVASYLDAKQHRGLWRIRLDDLDTPRNQPGAGDAILRTLEQHQLHWDGPVLYQSQRLDLYRAALNSLANRQLTFYCRCSRRMLDPSKPYPGTCRNQVQPPVGEEYAVRVLTLGTEIGFVAQVEGPQLADISATSGDFIVWRRDGIPSYQLATATDDGDSNITHIVRGNDLLTDTPRQLYLVDALTGTRANYAHLPVLVDDQGVKLSKRTGAKEVDSTKPLQNLALAVSYLGLAVPANWQQMDCPTLLAWAIQAWQLPTSNTSNPTIVL